MKNLLQKKSLDMLEGIVQEDQEHVTSSDEEDNIEEKVPARAYKKYKTILEVISQLDESFPASAVTVNNDVYVVVDFSIEEKFVSVIIKKEKAVTLTDFTSLTYNLKQNCLTSLET